MTPKYILAALMLVAALTFAACGDDDSDDGGDGGNEAAQTTEAPAEPAALTITVTDDAVDIPVSTPPGVTELTLQNDGKKPASAQLLRLEGDPTEKQVIDDFNSIGEGGKIPDYITAGGGVSTTAPGQSTTVTQELEEGRYIAINDEVDKVGRSDYLFFDVTGEASEAELPEGTPVTAEDGEANADYVFDVAGPIPAAEPVAFENAGDEPHHIVAFPIQPGKTLDDLEQFLKTEKGPPPIAGEPTGTAVLGADQTVVGDIGLKPGTYGFVCFISDADGGKSHFEKGMIDEVVVE